MDTKPSKPALPLTHWDHGYEGIAIEDKDGQELDPEHIAWLNSVAEAHGPALKAMRKARKQLGSGLFSPATLLEEVDQAIALMEKAPEPTP